jgi:hypothetical protein
MPGHVGRPTDNNPSKGIYRPTRPGGAPPDNQEQRVAEFSYQSDALADLIVQTWNNTNTLYTRLMTPPIANAGAETTRMREAKIELAKRGIILKEPLVISEDEYYAGYTMSSNDGVVFVLPNATRVDAHATNTGTPPPAGTPLLEAAKLLMACTPNGI